MGIFEMVLDVERLPVQVDVRQDLHSALQVEDYSSAAMTGYILALWRQFAPSIRSRDSSSARTLPSRRAKLLALLEAQSIEHYQFINKTANGLSSFVGHGPLTSDGSPSVSVIAGLGSVSTIVIHQQWCVTVPPAYIGYDIVECANRIREQRPEFRVDGVWSHLSDDDLLLQVREHRKFLSRRAS